MNANFSLHFITGLLILFCGGSFCLVCFGEDVEKSFFLCNENCQSFQFGL